MSQRDSSMVAAVRLRHRRRSRDWEDSLRHDLDDLVGLADQVKNEMCLVGGVGLAVRGEEFRRNHSDFDLAVFLSDLPEVIASFEGAGYRLHAASAGFCLSPWHRVDLLRKVTVPAVVANPDRFCLRLVRSDDENSMMYYRKRTDVMDLLIMDFVNEGILLHGYDRIVPNSDFFPLARYSDSRYLRLPNVRYKTHLPTAWPRQRKDLAQAGLR